MILQNQRLLAEICDNTGALVRLMDKRSGMELVVSPVNWPFRS